ncbi:hypothetical protein V5739_12885 [Salinimicrobium sp. TIG7-5_MAKvit]|uniref:hypothetical protein n=1 Tax=Salinimicrobium sp. TIG7-5_MAKvit TaxID=3121289 RepID=UPI003C6E968F
MENDRFEKRLHYAYILSMITIGYNLVEGGVSTFFGASDETLALFGFGLDSFVEVLSGVGITHMIYRMKRNPVTERDGFEVTALKNCLVHSCRRTCSGRCTGHHQQV